jgi:hypothetical protein
MLPNPFDAVFYIPNPSVFQVGQTVSILPGPGSQGVNYAITSGTLPAGLSLNATTGAITGTPTMLYPSATTVITCTNQDSTVFSVSVNITITNIPVLALASNQASSMDLVAFQAYRENLFMIETNNMILNQNQLGRYELVVNLPWEVSFNNMQTYYNSLGYTFFPVYFHQNVSGVFGLSFGAYASPVGYPLIGTNAGYPEIAPANRQVRISWSSYPYINTNQRFPGYPTFT